jgi:predicted nucleic acid-binding protein
LWAVTQEAGTLLSEHDLLIAASAIFYDRTLITADGGLHDALSRNRVAAELLPLR